VGELVEGEAQVSERGRKDGREREVVGCRVKFECGEGGWKVVEGVGVVMDKDLEYFMKVVMGKISK
jgi:hypothetical protein